MVGGRLLDISGVVKVRVMVWVRILVSNANVDASDFLTKTPFRSVCKMVSCICFPAYIALDGPLRRTMHCRACNGGNSVFDMLVELRPDFLPGVLPGVLAELPGELLEVLAAKA